MKGILELNISPDPEWALEFNNILKERYGLSVLDASCITGEAENCVKKFKKPEKEEIRKILDLSKKAGKEVSLDNTSEELFTERIIEKILENYG